MSVHQLAIERFTGGLKVISTDHAYIHKGIGFSFSTNTGSVSAGADYDYNFTTPAGAYIHIRPTSIAASANIMSVSLYEGATRSATGGTITPVNRNRNSSTASGVTVNYGVTTTGTGTLLRQLVVGAGGVTSRSGGGGSGEENEWILKPSTNYLIRVSNIGSTTASTGYITMFWYEEGTGV